MRGRAKRLLNSVFTPAVSRGQKTREIERERESGCSCAQDGCSQCWVPVGVSGYSSAVTSLPEIGSPPPLNCRINAGPTSAKHSQCSQLCCVTLRGSRAFQWASRRIFVTFTCLLVDIECRDILKILKMDCLTYNLLLLMRMAYFERKHTLLLSINNFWCMNPLDVDWPSLRDFLSLYWSETGFKV